MEILEKNLLILASAGSGKTFQLGNRVIGLVVDQVAPERIVALTFTRKAAGEFADSILTKLARAATDDVVAKQLREAIHRPQADFSAVLEQVVRALPRLMLGTMDGFFSKVVRGFQYELGLSGGKFDLLEGSRAIAARDEILIEILGQSLDEARATEFLHAFRRSNMGKEDQKVLASLRSFAQDWQSHYRTAKSKEWGPEFITQVHLDDWEKHKHALAATVLRGLDGIEFTDKSGGQRAALEKVVVELTEHTIGSGNLGKPSSLLKSIMEVVAKTDGPLFVKFRKEFLIGGPAGDALRDLIRLAAHGEMAAAVQRTRAVREVISLYDSRCESQLRQRGKLGFEDIKILMGEWLGNEEARLKREAVDFRLDARHDHWLLDEFQDTSRADWLGLVPLIDEAASKDNGGVFIVGDRKQAIYAWRGGEVSLFDEVLTRYGHGREDGIKTESMSESWRSSPEVLALVNHVCSDRATLRELFGDAEARWQWEEHISAAPLAVSSMRGEARVEIVEGKQEDRLERLTTLLDELQVGKRAMTCGVLVRSNHHVMVVADHLRAAGYDVIEEGRREPGKDNPVGLAISHLLKWLANPADSFAHEVVKMSPLAEILYRRFGEHWQRVWEGLTADAANCGFSKMVAQVIAEPQLSWSTFGQRRAGDLIMALAQLDAQGAVTAREAAAWVDRLEVSQSPGMAAVQVMTIHKSKGLGFDVVVLPEVSKEVVPSALYFDVAQTDTWISQTPPKWARDLIPAMRDAENEWGTNQRYEALCLMYVALTRAKRGLYLLLEPPSKTAAEDKSSPANWIARSVTSEAAPGVIYQSGNTDWVETVAALTSASPSTPLPPLTPGVARRDRTTPSRLKPSPDDVILSSTGGRRFGNEVHAAFERVGWVDEERAKLPAGEAGALIERLLTSSKVRPLFERRGSEIELRQEQAVDAIIDGRWHSGIIDRLHLHRATTGEVTRVEIIDFKTDAVPTLQALTERYGAQLQTYREMMQLAYPQAEVVCLLISSCLEDLVSVA